MRYLSLIIILLFVGCGIENSSKQSQKNLTEVVIKDVFMTDYFQIVYIARTPDNKESKTIRIQSDSSIDYVPIIGDTVYVSDWDKGTWGYAKIQKVKVPEQIKAEIEE